MAGVSAVSDRPAGGRSVPAPVRLEAAERLGRLLYHQRRWGVSVSVLAYRLHKLGIVSNWLYRGMVIEIGRRGYRTAEPNGIVREESLLWKKVLSDLWHDRITKAHIAADLRLPPDEIENLVFGLNGMPSAPPEQARERPIKPALRLV